MIDFERPIIKIALKMLIEEKLGFPLLKPTK